jgi:hypothetical protein
LSKTPVAVAIQSEFLSKNEMAFPAILLPAVTDNEPQRMILHQSHHLPPGTQIQIEQGSDLCKSVVADIEQTQREFIVYRLEQLEK